MPVYLDVNEVIADRAQIQGLVHEHNEVKRLLDEIENWQIGGRLTFPLADFNKVYKKYFK